MRFLVIIAIVFPIQCFGQQNLIPNWSFEQRRLDFWGDTICSLGSSPIHHTNYWSIARGSVDYMNECHNEDNPSYGVPSNIFGTQPAYDGVAYAHFLSYYYDETGWGGTNIREMLWLPLPDSLRSGMEYSFQFKVSLADSAQYATNKIGALFTHFDTRYLVHEEFFNYQPQIESSGEIINNNDGWVNIGGQFVAEGGEQYLTIGTFHSDDSLIVEQLRPFYYAEAYGHYGYSSYYIDAVELYESHRIDVNENDQIVLQVYPNPTKGNITLDLGLEPIQLTIATYNTLGALIESEVKSVVGPFNYAMPKENGVYLVQLIVPNGAIYNLKVVKE